MVHATEKVININFDQLLVFISQIILFVVSLLLQTCFRIIFLTNLMMVSKLVLDSYYASDVLSKESCVMLTMMTVCE